MTFLPIVERELRVAARRRGTFWSRLVAAILGLGLGTWVLLANHDVQPQLLGQILFQTLSALVFIYAMIVGTQVTSDCLSEEKREGTLGLLFLTDLKGYDVVFGKLVATSINAFYGMLAVVPILAIPLLLGGVTNAEFWRVVLVCINLLLFTLSVGIFASAVSRSDHQALGLAILFAATLLLAPPIAAAIYEMRHRMGNSVLFLFTPAYSCFLAFDDLHKGNASHFWLNTAITQIYCWTFLFLACRIVPRSWQDATSVKEQKGWWRTFRQWLEGGPAKRAALRGKLLDINPYLWRTGSSRFKMQLIWAILALVGIVWVWMHHLIRDEWFEVGRCVAVALFLHTLFKFFLAFESVRNLSEDRRSGAMELLLSTPLTEKDIVRGQRLALWRLYGGPVLAILLMDLVFLLTAISHNPHDRDQILSFYLVAGTFFVLDLVALGWVGMWLGLSGRKPNRAALLALARIIALPCLIFVIGISLAAFFNNLSLSWIGSLVFWCILGLVTNAVFAFGARGKLLGHFRDVVAQRFGKSKTETPPVVLPVSAGKVSP